jgi:hypothetical protein
MLLLPSPLNHRFANYEDYESYRDRNYKGGEISKLLDAGPAELHTIDNSVHFHQPSSQRRHLHEDTIPTHLQQLVARR